MAEMCNMQFSGFMFQYIAQYLENVLIVYHYKGVHNLKSIVTILHLRLAFNLENGQHMNIMHYFLI